MRISDWSSDVCSSDLAKHVDAGLVAVEHFLRAFADKIGDLGALRTNRRIKRNTGDSGAHRAFGEFPDGVIRLGTFEKKMLGSANLPAKGIGDVDAVRVAGQHQVRGDGGGCTNI